MWKIRYKYKSYDSKRGRFYAIVTPREMVNLFVELSFAMVNTKFKVSFFIATDAEMSEFLKDLKR